MSATLIEFPSAPLRIPSESNHQRILRDLSVATVTLKLVAECEDLAADLRSLVEAAHLRLLGTVQQLSS
jgi:hypothetical protein